MIVERSPSVRARIAKSLRDANFPVHECVNVEDAMHAMTKHGVPKAFVVANKIGKETNAGVRFVQALSSLATLRERPTVVLVSQRTLKSVARSLPEYVEAVPLEGELEQLVATLGCAAPQPERAANTGPPDPLWAELETTVSTMDDALALCRSVAERVRKNELPGPMVPELLEKVRRLCAQKSVQPRKLCGFIERHQSLSVRFLSMANSAYYSRGARIKTVTHAVARIGAEPCLTLMQAIAAREYVVGRDRQLRAMISAGLEQAYIVSAVAKTLAGLTTDVDPADAGLVGLFHNIGRTFLLYTFGLLLDEDKAPPIALPSLETITQSRAFDLNRIIVRAMRLPEDINFVFAPSTLEVSPTVQAVRRAIWISESIFEGNPRAEFDGQAKLLGFDADTIHAVNQKMPSYASLLREYRR